MAKRLKPCGTSAAYRRHLRRWEWPCESCTKAHAADERVRYAARQARAQATRVAA